MPTVLRASGVKAAKSEALESARIVGTAGLTSKLLPKLLQARTA